MNEEEPIMADGTYESDPPYVNLQQAKELLGVSSTQYVRQLARRGRLAGSTKNSKGRVLIPRASIDSYLQQRELTVRRYSCFLTVEQAATIEAFAGEQGWGDIDLVPSTR